MEEESTTIVEEREEVMVSPLGDSKPTLRTAHFLKPTIKLQQRTSSKLPSLPPSSFSSPPRTHKIPLNVNFNGWKNPSSNWKSWVAHMKPKHQSLWKKSGLYEAIICSTYTIPKDGDLIVALAEKWCPETNTFIFPWGETTVTLEDVVVLGGFSVIGGSPVFSWPLETRALQEIEEKLKKARTVVAKGPAKKVSLDGWMKMFICSGSEVEHEAFLSYWLERFVFHEDSGSAQILRGKFFPLAIRLARGERYALAPAVLANVYRDLSLLKAAIVATNSDLDTNENGGGDDLLKLTLWSPLHLVQLWAWERFEAFQPKPNRIKNGEPRAAFWDDLKGVKVEKVRLGLESAGETFRWRPYTTTMDGWQFHEFYKEKEEWVDVGCNENILSFAICLRASELVGMGFNIEHYLPHRVALQFGIDQDIPCDVSPSNGGPELAWINHIRPFDNPMLLIPSRFFEPDVTVRYLDWWKKSLLCLQDKRKDLINNVVRRKRSSMKRLKRVPNAIEENIAAVAPAFPPKCKTQTMDSMGEKGGNVVDAPPGFPPKYRTAEIKDLRLMGKEGHFTDVPHECPPKLKSLEDLLEKRVCNAADSPPGFPSKFKTTEFNELMRRRECNFADAASDLPPKFKMADDKELVGKRVCNTANVPPVSLPYSKMTDIKDSDEDVKPTKDEILRVIAMGKKVADRPSSEMKHPAGQHSNFSNAKVNDGAFEHMDLQVEIENSFMHVISPIGTSIGDKDDIIDRKPDISNYGAASSSCSGGKSNALSLEARIAVLERQIAQLKKERLHHTVGS